MQHRVERAGADLVTVASQLLHHLDPEDRLLHGMVEDMQPHEPAEEHLGQQLAHG